MTDSAGTAGPGTLAPPVPTERVPAMRHRVRGGVLILLCGFYALSYIDRVNISTAAPYIQADLHLSDSQLGLVLSAFALPYALLQVFGGWIGDRLGARRTLSWLACVWAVATAATGAATGLASLFSARLLLGLGESAAFPSATQAMSRWLPAQLRAFGQGVVHAASRLGNAAAPLIVGGLIALSGWRISFWILGVLSLVWAAIWVRFYRDVPQDHPRTTDRELRELPDGGRAAPRRAGTPWRAMLPALLPVLIVDFCYGWLLWVYLTWLPSLFKNDFGLKLGGFALYTSLVLLAGVVGDLVGGRLSDDLLRRRGARTARRLPLIVGLTGSLVCLVPSLVWHSLLTTTISLAAAFFFLELTNSTIWALPMDIAPEYAGAASGLVNTGFGIAGVLSPSVFGILLDASGGDWQLPLLLSALVLGVGALCSLRVDPDRRVAVTAPSSQAGA
jgi:MFS family permease